MTRLCLTALTRAELDSKIDEQLDGLDRREIRAIDRGTSVWTPNRAAPQLVAVIWLA